MCAFSLPLPGVAIAWLAAGLRVVGRRLRLGRVDDDGGFLRLVGGLRRVQVGFDAANGVLLHTVFHAEGGGGLRRGGGDILSQEVSRGAQTYKSNAHDLIPFVVDAPMMDCRY
ncbi:hypothetical protein VF14_18320 [Nostoc linckia z18]|uniref:Uncharacterized protein n=2 Tax=Nostoc linckia TaxID=92942 RepID=A0A9Q5Z930_NOSLI|nr:hypothetical protein VF02_37205 [Nostoc linckia z1]PHJ81974.1 hypothetical protein VF07_29210 [Nostoc linckia z6]PHJ92872.1 hypothetical protein VF04_27925 [Nostoc linckia z7]PHK00805.1 hypothetical protein VF08_23320 [Nostoc linckia z8]PHK09317.1 hypothetical protein VF09_15985 [Nostoc linckia z9]PHK33079.1 hypothetical protein VF14_18320 [Nostoc linckia z18]